MMIALSLLASCVETHAGYSNLPCYYPDQTSLKAPGWICHQQNSSRLITAVGESAQSLAGATFSQQMATANARVKLAIRLQDLCGVSKVSDAMLINSRPLNIQRSPRGTHYVQVGIKPSDLRLSCR